MTCGDAARASIMDELAFREARHSRPRSGRAESRWRSIRRPDQLDALVAAVRTNCHVTDARHARDMTMCTYLLEMRELYRWERGYRARCGAAACGRRRMARRSARRSGTRSSTPTTGRCRSSTRSSIPSTSKRSIARWFRQGWSTAPASVASASPSSSSPSSSARSGATACGCSSPAASTRAMSRRARRAARRHDLRAHGIAAAAAVGAGRAVERAGERRRAEGGARRLRLRGRARWPRSSGWPTPRPRR